MVLCFEGLPEIPLELDQGKASVKLIEGGYRLSGRILSGLGRVVEREGLRFGGWVVGWIVAC